MSDPDFSRLKTFIADDKEEGPDSVLVIKGFAGREEIELFVDALLSVGIFTPPGKTQ